MNGHRRSTQELGTFLTNLLHPDVIPLVLGYEATIQLEFVQSYGSQSSVGDGELHSPLAVVVNQDELLILDTHNHRIQVFHQRTGRFLRKWGRFGTGVGEFTLPVAGAIAMGGRGTRGQERIFVLDSRRKDIQVFRLSDSQYLHGFSLAERNGWPCGMALLGDEIVVSRFDPTSIDNRTQIQVLTQAEGKDLRILANEEELRELCECKLFVEQDTNLLFITDTDNHRILVLDLASGRIKQHYGGRIQSLYYPRAVVTHGDMVIVADSHNDRLVIFDRITTQMLRRVGPKKSSRSSPPLHFYNFNMPSDVAVNSNNQLFVCDTGHDRVLMFE